LPESKVRKSVADKRRRTGASQAAAGKSAASKASPGSTTRTSAGKTSESPARTAKRVSRLIEQEDQPRRPWLLPVTIALAVLGIAWGVLYVVDDKLIPYEHKLGVWNYAIGAGAIVVAAVLYLALRPRSGTQYAPGARRWVAPAFIGVGLFGVAWLIVYYVAGDYVPFMTPLGNWNILIGMGGMAVAFVLATLWK
jgi:hypothetical protein